ncbi:hypothetical protein SKAU_G00242110 [Synaphobranchus kaupii]|uniref:Uncharacterized protein n=1 Tax=Synaphobranchus kaupii TaxID=118154 RepID=A0A9Q1ITF9_SYNKA|nr:hypothetical protein SKAU_G00242110 [Synaphobranchus kaupii]
MHFHHRSLPRRSGRSLSPVCPHLGNAVRRLLPLRRRNPPESRASALRSLVSPSGFSTVSTWRTAQSLSTAEQQRSSDCAAQALAPGARPRADSNLSGPCEARRAGPSRGPAGLARGKRKARDPSGQSMGNCMSARDPRKNSVCEENECVYKLEPLPGREPQRSVFGELWASKLEVVKSTTKGHFERGSEVRNPNSPRSVRNKSSAGRQPDHFLLRSAMASLGMMET